MAVPGAESGVDGKRTDFERAGRFHVQRPGFQSGTAAVARPWPGVGNDVSGSDGRQVRLQLQPPSRPRGVYAVDSSKIKGVGAVVQAQVVVPVTEFGAPTGRGRHVLRGRFLEGQKPVRIKGPHQPGRGPHGIPPGAAGQTLADRPAAEGVQFPGAVRQGHRRVEEEGPEVILGLAENDLPLHGRRVRTHRVQTAGFEGPVRPALVEQFQRQVQGPLGAEGQPDIGGSPVAFTVALPRHTGFHAGGGLSGLFLENDIDDAADGVGAVLGNGTVPQDLDTLDGCQRNGAQVNAGGALQRRIQRPWKRQTVPALAIDEDHRVVGRRAPQQGAVKQAAVANGIALRIERGGHPLQRDSEVRSSAGGHFFDIVDLDGNGQVFQGDPTDPGSDNNKFFQLERKASDLRGGGLHIALFHHGLRRVVLGQDTGSRYEDHHECRQCQRSTRVQG